MTKWSESNVNIVECLKQFRSWYHHKQESAFIVATPEQLASQIITFTKLLSEPNLSESYKNAINYQINYLKTLQSANE